MKNTKPCQFCVYPASSAHVGDDGQVVHLCYNHLAKIDPGYDGTYVEDDDARGSIIGPYEYTKFMAEQK